jgi:hypothetical protein
MHRTARAKGSHPSNRVDLACAHWAIERVAGWDKLVTNPDGTVDLTFGPTQLGENAANWTQTVPGKGWFAILRLYGPLEPWFDRSWRPGEIEPIAA